MPDAHELHGLRYAKRLKRIYRLGPTGRYVAESAGAGTYISQDHEGRGSCSPAFTHIRTITALTDRVQLVFAHDFPDLLVFFSDR